MLLEGKTAVITGAGSGVGRAASIVFSREGANVVCVDVEEEWADETVKLVEERGGTATAVTCDVTREAQVVDAIARAVTQFGQLDVMYNNAGIATPPGAGPFESYDDDAWNRLMSINLHGVFYGMKHAIVQMKSQGQGGAIVNTGSVAGIVGWGGTVYGVTKGAVNQMTRTVAIEVASSDIRVNAVCPAAMATNFGVSDRSQAFAPRPAKVLDALAEMHPLGRTIDPEDCAEAACFLASERARNITGVLLPVDGGYTAR